MRGEMFLSNDNASLWVSRPDQTEWSRVIHYLPNHSLSVLQSPGTKTTKWCKADVELILHQIGRFFSNDTRVGPIKVKFLPASTTLADNFHQNQSTDKSDPLSHLFNPFINKSTSSSYNSATKAWNRRVPHLRSRAWNTMVMPMRFSTR